MTYTLPACIERRASRSLVLCTAAAAAFSAPWSCAAAPDFDHVFSTRGEPAATHLHATYLTGGTEHHVEVWRDGERRIRQASSATTRTPTSSATDDMRERSVIRR